MVGFVRAERVPKELLPRQQLVRPAEPRADCALKADGSAQGLAEYKAAGGLSSRSWTPAPKTMQQNITLGAP